MACKEKLNLPIKNKHYTLLERKVFLQILNDYKHIIESKKNNSATLKEKDVAWSEICNKFNQSTLISQEVINNYVYVHINIKNVIQQFYIGFIKIILY